MLRKPLIIIGSGGHGRVVNDAAALGGWVVAGFVDDTKPIGSDVGGLPILGGLAALSETNWITGYAFAVAIGDQAARSRISADLLAKGAQLPTVVHPRAIVSPTARLDCGTVAMANCVVNPGATIGRFCILNTGCTVDHDVVLHDGVQIAPGVNLAGRVICEAGVFIGTGAAVIPDVVVGWGSIVGAGSVVIRDVPPDCTVVGNPARIIRSSST